MYEERTTEATSRIPDRTLHAIFLACMLGWILFLLGCSTKGDSSSDTTVFQVKVVPVKIAREGSSDLHGLFAFAKGAGVTGFRLLDPQKNELKTVTEYDSVNQEYRCIITRDPNGFSSGQYTIQYFLNGETKEYVSTALEWATIPVFPNSPTSEFDQSNSMLTVRYSNISGPYRFRLEFFDSDIFVGTLLAQSYEYVYSSVFTERMNQAGRRLTIVLVGNNYTSGDLYSKTMYQFLPQVF